MTNEEIIRLRILNELYYSASATHEEEAERRLLLKNSSLPEEFAADREMIEHIGSAAIPDGFEMRLAAKIDTIAEAEHLDDSPAGNIRHRKFMSIWSMAASIAVAIAMVCTFFLTDRSSWENSSELSPEETYAQVDNALTLFANALDRGYKEAYEAETTAGNAATKALESLSRLSTPKNNI